MKRKKSPIFFYYRIAILLLMAFVLIHVLRQGATTEPAQQDATPAEQTIAADSTEAALLLPAPLTNCSEQLLRREGYILSYNKDRLQANWVYWLLTPERTEGNNNAKDFHDDLDVPAPRPSKWDYYNSGYDRGHMCPAADNKYSAAARRDCYLYTNMSPQNHQLNSGLWNTLEMRCRTWAKKRGPLHIVCGPIYTSEHTKTIGQNRVAVPDAYFKAIVSLSPSPFSAAYIMPNRNIDGPLNAYAVSIDSIETLTGFDLFAPLESDMEARLEQ